MVAVIGDGALTGGMAWEALNNIAAAPDRPVDHRLNDNGRSYSPTIGGLADHLATLRITRRRAVPAGQALRSRPRSSQPLRSCTAKKRLKDASRRRLFEDSA